MLRPTCWSPPQLSHRNHEMSDLPEFPLHTPIASADSHAISTELVAALVAELVSMQTFVEAMPRVRPYYAVKCNPHGGVVRALADLGCGFDCASGREAKQVLAAGVPPASIILANTCKCPADLRYAASVSVMRMTFDCEDELDKIADVWPQAQLVLRIRADDPTAVVPLGEKFGADVITEAPALLAAAKLRKLAVIGVSFHVGSISQSPESYRSAICAARQVFDAGAAVGYRFYLLDIGGGFLGRFGGDGAVDMAHVASEVNGALHDCFPSEHNGGLEVIAEPGRFFAETCMTMFTMVHTVKTRPDESRMYYITDGLHGSHSEVHTGRREVRAHILRSPALPPPAAHATTELVRSTVFGPTCDSWDRILEDVPMPLLRRGDWLQFADHGAYSVSFSTAFNGFAAVEAPTYYVRSREPVADDMGDGKVVLRRGLAKVSALWRGREEELCLVASPEDLGIHCRH